MRICLFFGVVDLLAWFVRFCLQTWITYHRAKKFYLTSIGSRLKTIIIANLQQQQLVSFHRYFALLFAHPHQTIYASHLFNLIHFFCSCCCFCCPIIAFFFLTSSRLRSSTTSSRLAHLVILMNYSADGCLAHR